MTIRYLIAVLLMFSLRAGTQIQAQPTQSEQSPLALDLSSPENLKLQMRTLWTGRAAWSRAYLTAALNDAPDAEVSANRLFTTDEDITRALAVFYDGNAGRRVQQALHDQSSTLASLTRAATISAGTIGTSASDPSNMGQLLQQWYHTRDTIDSALGGDNDHSSDALPDALEAYLSATMKELEARVNHDWGGDAQAFDDARNTALRVADAMSDRIVAKFRDRFTAGATGTIGLR